MRCPRVVDKLDTSPFSHVVSNMSRNLKVEANVSWFSKRRMDGFRKLQQEAMRIAHMKSIDANYRPVLLVPISVIFQGYLSDDP